MRAIRLLVAVALAALASASCSSNVQSSDGEVGPYTVITIEKNVYHIQDFTSANPAGESFNPDGSKSHFNNCSDIYLLVGGSKALMIDLSNDLVDVDNAAESLRSIVADRIGDKPLTITFTHNHGDHTGMFRAFREDQAVSFAVPEADFQGKVPEDVIQRCEFYNEGYEFDLGGLKVEAVAVPGHTPGSMVFDLKGHDMLFTGDAIGSGHGVWIFNRDAFYAYVSGVYHLMTYIEDPANGIDKDALKIFGGHYWQRDWLDYAEGEEMGWQYVCDMKTLIDQMERGEAASEPSGLNFRNLDTYFRFGEAIVVWNAAELQEYLGEYSETIVYRDEDLVFRQIDEHTWEGNGHLCYNESVYLIEGEEKALLIDAGMVMRHLADAVATLTDKPVTLVATHVHGDHTGCGVLQFPELYVNAADAVQAGLSLNDVNEFLGQYDLDVRFLWDGQVFDLGGREIEVVFTPGHTPGSTTFVDKAHHYGFSGDSFGSTNLLLGTNFSTLAGTSDKMAYLMKKYGIEKLYPGHYGNNPETLQRVLDLGTMAREMLDGERTGVTEPGQSWLDSYINDHGVTVRYKNPDALK